MRLPGAVSGFPGGTGCRGDVGGLRGCVRGLGDVDEKLGDVRTADRANGSLFAGASRGGGGYCDDRLGGSAPIARQFSGQ